MIEFLEHSHHITAGYRLVKIIKMEGSVVNYLVSRCSLLVEDLLI